MQIVDSWKLKLKDRKIDVLVWSWPEITYLVALSVGGLYLWGAIYSLYFTRSLSSFSLPPWFVLQVLMEFNTAGRNVLMATGGAVFFLLAVLYNGRLHRRQLDKSHGDARWATSRDIRKSGLFARKGIVLGKYKGRYLFFDEAGHVLVYWPTRSGKGVGIVIPNLLNWPDSVIVQDIKGENFKKTSGFRHKFGQKVIVWDVMSPRTFRYNPLYYVRKDPVNRIGDIQRISFVLFDRENDRGDPWNPEARSMFLALVLYLMDVYPDTVSIGEVVRILKANSDFRYFLLVSLHDKGDILDAQTVDNFTSHLQKPPKEASAVLTQLKSVLELWSNPIIDAATYRNDFDLRDMRKKHMSIYVKVNPGDIGIVSPLLNLFYQQFIDLMTRKEPEADEPLHVLMLLDEFTAAGKLTIIENAIAFMAGYQIKLMPIIQGPSQLERLYTKEGARNFSANFAIQSVAAQNDATSAEAVSNMLGTKTIKSESRSEKAFKIDIGDISTSTSRTGKRLLTNDQVRRLDKSKMILLKEGGRPVLAKKIKYYRSLTQLLRTLIKPSIVPEIDIVKYKKIFDRNRNRYIVCDDHPALKEELEGFG